MNIPKDGYYTVDVQYDTGGTLPTYVYVHNGIIRSNAGNEIKLDACSRLHPASTQQFCGVWPREAAMELEALRTANAGLVEKVRRLVEAGDKLSACADCVVSPSDAMQYLRNWVKAKGQP